MGRSPTRWRGATSSSTSPSRPRRRSLNRVPLSVSIRDWRLLPGRSSRPPWEWHPRASARPVLSTCPSCSGRHRPSTKAEYPKKTGNSGDDRNRAARMPLSRPGGKQLHGPGVAVRGVRGRGIVAARQRAEAGSEIVGLLLKEKIRDHNRLVRVDPVGVYQSPARFQVTPPADSGSS